MNVKYLYEGNRDFELSRQLFSEDEVRAFIDLHFKQKSNQSFQEYTKNVMGLLRVGIGIFFIIFGLAVVSWLNTMMQYGPPNDALPLLCLHVFPLTVLFAGCLVSYKAVRLLFQPLDDYQTKQILQTYQDLMHSGRTHVGQVIEVESLSPTTRRIRFSSALNTRYQRGLHDASFITSSSVALAPSDSVVVLTHEIFRVLI